MAITNNYNFSNLLMTQDDEGFMLRWNILFGTCVVQPILIYMRKHFSSNSGSRYEKAKFLGQN